MLTLKKIIYVASLIIFSNFYSIVKFKNLRLIDSSYSLIVKLVLSENKQIKFCV